MEKKIVTNSIEINASSESVWDALINPEKTKVYMFGCETVSDWKVGSPLLWRGSYEGNEMVFVRGFIVEFEKNHHLKYTVIDPNAAMDDIPDNYLNVLYELSGTGKQTCLTVTQDGFEKAADGEKRYQDVYNKGDGWNPVLVQIKSLVESA